MAEAESGGNKMAATKSGGKLAESHIPKDFLEIRQTTKTVIQEFTDYLAQKNIPGPEQIAQDLLLNGGTLSPNGPGDCDDINNEAERRRKLIPTFLFIMAVTEPAGSIKRKNEEKILEKQRSNFLECVMEIDYRILAPSENPFVESYDEMLQQIESFFEEKSAVKRSNLPIIVSLGHGSEDGMLCFTDENIWPHVNTALADICSCFDKGRPKDMPSCQLRVVFSQCYAHLIDSSHHTPGEVGFDKIERMYFPCPDSPTVTEQTTGEPDISLLKNLTFHSDVALEVDGSDPFFTSAVSELKKDLAGDPDFTKYIDDDDEIKHFIIHGPDDHLSENIKNKIQQQRRKMRMFLQIICPSLHEFEDHLDKLRSLLDIPADDTKTVRLLRQSEQTFHGTITSFLTGDAEDVYMPVIIVTADGSMHSNDTEFMLHVGQSTPVDAQKTLDDHRRDEKGNLRLIILLHDGTSHMVTNSMPPEIDDSKILVLHEYAYVIIGDSKQNKTGIRAPKGERGHRNDAE